MPNTSDALERFDRRDLTLGLLAVASSATDVIAFVKLQQVFTSAMTGNTALLGLAIGQGHVLAALNSAMALMGYTCGVMLGALVRTRNGARDLIFTLLIEAVFLGVFVLLWHRFGFPENGHWLEAMIASSAMAMGVQSVAARKVNLEGIPTVVFTSTLTSIVTTLTHLGTRGSPPSLFNTKRQSLAFALYGAGAVFTAFLLWTDLEVAIGVPLLAVVIAVTVQFILPPTPPTPRS